MGSAGRIWEISHNIPRCPDSSYRRPAGYQRVNIESAGRRRAIQPVSNASEDTTQTIGRPKTHGDKSGMLSSKAGRPATLRISVFKFNPTQHASPRWRTSSRGLQLTSPPSSACCAPCLRGSASGISRCPAEPQGLRVPHRLLDESHRGVRAGLMIDDAARCPRFRGDV